MKMDNKIYVIVWANGHGYKQLLEAFSSKEAAETKKEKYIKDFSKTSFFKKLFRAGSYFYIQPLLYTVSKKIKIDDPNCPLFGFKATKKTLKQTNINFDWVFSKIEEIHSYLCPDKTGTWQMRTEQAVEAAKKIKEK